MKCRVLFYKSKWGDGHWIDNLISLWTRSKYSHVEIWLPNEIGKFRGNLGRIYGTCWTSTMRGEDNGTVMRDASGVIQNPERWDYIELDVIFVEQMMLYMEGAVNNNMGYSKWDLLKFASLYHFDDKTRNICSEFCNNALFFAMILKKFGIVSPGKLHKILTKLGHETKELA